jgi:hypothetical protein
MSEKAVVHHTQTVLACLFSDGIIPFELPQAV